MNKKKVYEKKLNNLKKYKMDELKKITVQQQEMMSKITGFMELQDQVLTTMAGILSEQDQQICGMTETMKAQERAAKRFLMIKCSSQELKRSLSAGYRPDQNR